MLILALETATRAGSVALFDGDACDARVGDASRTHGERLPGELLDLLAAHQRSLRDVDRFAVVAGPGSFTGLRVGVATIQGLALATGARVVPVPTLDAMADGWRMAQPPHVASAPRERTDVVCALDGQRGDLFFAAWSFDAGEVVDDARALIPASVGRPGDLLEAVRNAVSADRAVLVSQGLERHADALRALTLPAWHLRTPLADVAARIAARREAAAVAPHALRPLYIRRPDAVLARERAGLVPRVGS